MRPDTVSKTALGTAIGRAIENRRSPGDRLCADDYAQKFLPPSYRAVVRLMRVPLLGRALLAARERQIPGVMGNLLCRTRFIDETLQGALAWGFEQILILGAGLDSRAFRIRGADRVPIFELDHPATQSWKRQRVESSRGSLPAHVAYVPIDFQRQEPEEVLAAAGFRPGAKTFVIWEGVTQYIGAEAVDATFRFLTRACGRGSEVVFTYIQAELLDGSLPSRGAAGFLRELERQGEPWIFGIRTADLAGYLGSHGLELLQDVGARDYRVMYLAPFGRRMNLFEGERIAVARI